MKNTKSMDIIRPASSVDPLVKRSVFGRPLKPVKTTPKISRTTSVDPLAKNAEPTSESIPVRLFSATPNKALPSDDFLADSLPPKTQNVFVDKKIEGQISLEAKRELARMGISNPRKQAEKPEPARMGISNPRKQAEKPEKKAETKPEVKLEQKPERKPIIEANGGVELKKEIDPLEEALLEIEKNEGVKSPFLEYVNVEKRPLGDVAKKPLSSVVTEVADRASKIFEADKRYNPEKDPRRKRKDDPIRRKKNVNRGLPMPVIVAIAVVLGIGAGIGVYFLIV